MISQGIITRINAEVNDKEAQEILYDHLVRHADRDSLMKYCEVIMDASGYPKMQEFGRKLQKELSSEVGQNL